MERRLFLGAVAALVAIRTAPAAAGPEHVPYTPEAFEAALAAREPLVLDFFAPW